MADAETALLLARAQFAITFAMGVVSGIVMSYQFGTNWSVFSDRAGPIIGPLMALKC